MAVTKEKTAMPEEHLAVYRAIANHSDKYITRKMILAQLGKTGDYGRRLSEIIYELVVKYKMPIGASSARETKGYFIIETKRDLYIAKRDIQSRTSSMNMRYKALDKMNF